MIDKAIRAKGLGGSDIAAIVNLDPYRDSYSVWAEKTGKTNSDDRLVSERMMWGTWLEKDIIRGYGLLTKQKVKYFNKTLTHPERYWQVYTPDAHILNRKAVKIRGIDAKKVSYNQRHAWNGGPPVHIVLQAQWYISASGLPWTIAALFDELLEFKIEPDQAAIDMILEAGHDFWFNHVQADIPPEPGHCEATTRAITKIYDVNKEAIRPATDTEYELVAELREAQRDFVVASKNLDKCKNMIRLAIGDAEGLAIGNDERITWKMSKNVVGIDWEKLATEQIDPDKLPWLIGQYETVVKSGSRRLLMPRSWTEEFEERAHGK